MTRITQGVSEEEIPNSYLPLTITIEEEGSYIWNIVVAEFPFLLPQSFIKQYAVITVDNDMITIHRKEWIIQIIRAVKIIGIKIPKQNRFDYD